MPNKKPFVGAQYMVDASTAHLSIDDRNKLTELSRLASRGLFVSPRVVSHEYGWLIFVGSALSRNEQKMFSEGLCQLYQIAVEGNAYLINFDADGDILDSVPTYE